MHGPVHLRLPRIPAGTPTYCGPVVVAEGWYLAILGGDRRWVDWMAHIRQWSGYEKPASPGFSLVRPMGAGRKLGVMFFPGTADGQVTIRLYGAAEPPDEVGLRLLPIPRALAAASIALQNLPALQTAYATGPGTRLARLRAGMAVAATRGPMLPERFAATLQADLESLVYRSWIARFDTLGPDDLAAIRRVLPGLPRLLVVCRFDGIDMPNAPGLVQDLRDQLHTGWRAVLDCDAVPTDDRRIAFGAPPARLADGECLVVIDGGLRLRPHTLSTLAAAVRPGTRLVYADEDRIDRYGERAEPFFRPDFSPELLRNQDYLGGCVLLAGPGDMDAAMDRDGADSLPRDSVVHVPLVLSHRVYRRPERLRHMVSYPIRLPTVSIIIPIRDRLELLRACLDSIDARTEYDRGRMEVVVVDNASADPATLDYLHAAEAAQRLRVLRDPGPFNYSSLNNQAAAASGAEILVFLNNDTEITDPRWLHHLTGLAMQPDVGAVGGKLLYPDGTVQHAGVVVGMVGVAAHIGIGSKADDPGYHGLAGATREVAAVTAACLAIRRSVFQQAGGFDPALAVAFNDVALCAAVLALGYRNLCVATPLLIHHESKSRGHDDTPEKAARFFEESVLGWRMLRRSIPADPFYSPNLGFDRLYGLAYPPRRRKPWRVGDAPRRVLLLGSGGTAAAAMAQQRAALQAAGYEVWIGAPSAGPGEPARGGHQVVLGESQDAAAFAVEHDIDCVVAHTPPFLSVLRWLGSWPVVVLCDHGEPGPEVFRTADRRQGLAERRICLAMAEHVLPPTADIAAYVSSLASQ